MRCGARKSDLQVGRQFWHPTRHSVVSEQGAQILLILAPSPGDGHYRADNPA
jgi:hypothetical protein